MVTRIFFLLILSLFKSDSFCQSRTTPQIKLDKSCFFDKQNRKTNDSLSDKIAKVTRKFNYIILIIDNKKYLTCNIPLTIRQKQLRVTGYILETFKTEKIIATPLKVTKATSL